MSEKLAKRFHETYERLAPAFGYETRQETRRFDPTSKNGRLMIAVTDEIEAEISTEVERLQEALEPFAKVGRIVRDEGETVYDAQEETDLRHYPHKWIAAADVLAPREIPAKEQDSADV